MPTPDTVQGIDLPIYDDPPAIPDDLSLIWYAMISRGIPRFSSAAALEAAYPSPVDGQHAVTGSGPSLQVWVAVGGEFVEAWSPGLARSYVSDAAGGGALTSAWTTAASSASLLLPEGTYLVSVKAGFTLSLSNNSNIEAHLFNAAGVAFGSGQGSNRNVPSNAQAGIGSFTAEFTRRITVTDPSSAVQVRGRITPTGGTHTFGAQSLTAVRVA